MNQEKETEGICMSSSGSVMVICSHDEALNALNLDFPTEKEHNALTA